MTGKQAFTRIYHDAMEAGYSRYTSFDATVSVDGVMETVKFYRIGHNATHDFHIGLSDDGRLITMSECEGEEIGATERHFTVRGTAAECEPVYYLGHY